MNSFLIFFALSALGLGGVLFSIWKGAAEERIAACVVVANLLIAVALIGVSPILAGTFGFASDGLSAVVLLVVTVRYGAPWMGGIMLLYAAQFPDAIAGAVVAAPHILVEDISVSSIELARKAYLETDLRARLVKYHDEPDSPFWGWNRIWLDPAFRAWSIEAEIANIRCPLLALQGRDDEYGTLRQIHGIAERLPQTELLELAHCGHSPHRDQPEKVIKAVTQFVHNHNLGDIS